jgi:hypothetical protein
MVRIEYRLFGTWANRSFAIPPQEARHLLNTHGARRLPRAGRHAASSRGQATYRLTDGLLLDVVAVRVLSNADRPNYAATVRS